MISLFINELPPLTTFNDSDKLIVDSVYTLAANMSSLRDYVLTSRVVPNLSATNLIVTNLSALSSTFVTIDVINYELSGFSVTGELTINPNSIDRYAIRTDSTSGAITVPVGTTLQRPSPAIQGALRFNTEDNTFEGYNGTEWGALGETVTTVFVDEPAGNITAGQLIEKGTSLQDLVDRLFTKTFFPIIGTNPFISIDSHTVGGQTNIFTVEAGTTSVLLNVSYNPGSILGRSAEWRPPNPPGPVSGVWTASTPQSGAGPSNPTSYTIMNTVCAVTTTTTNHISTGRIIGDGENIFNASVIHGTGPMPYNSKGGAFPSIRVAGATRSTSRTIVGARKIWYGTSITVNETNIRNIPNWQFSESSSSTNTFNIDIPVGATNVVIAAPEDVGTPVILQTGGGIVTDITSSFLPAQDLQVRGLNNFVGARSNYKIYVYAPIVAFTQTNTYQVTI